MVSVCANDRAASAPAACRQCLIHLMGERHLHAGKQQEGTEDIQVQSNCEISQLPVKIMMVRRTSPRVRHTPARGVVMPPEQRKAEQHQPDKDVIDRQRFLNQKPVRKASACGSATARPSVCTDTTRKRR